MKFIEHLKQWKRPLSTASLPLVALLTAGWTSPLRPPALGLDPTVLDADSRYMRQVFRKANPAGDSDAISIDLADPAQHRFVMNRLHASGKTPHNAPQLFARLRLAQEKAQARAVRPQQESTAELTTTTWGCDHFVLLAAKTVNSLHNIESGPMASCVRGASYIYVDVVGYDSNLAETDSVVVASNSGEEYSGGTGFDDVYVTPTLPIRRSRIFISDSMMIALNEQTGEEIITYSRALTSTSGTTASISSSDHPRRAVGSMNANVTSCQLRGGSDCDYAMVRDMNGKLVPYSEPPTGLALRLTTTPSWTGDRANYFTFPTDTPYDDYQVYLPTKFTFDAGTGVTSTGATMSCIIREVLSGTRSRLTKRVGGGTCATSTPTSSGPLVKEVEKLKGSRSGIVQRLIDMPSETYSTSNIPVDCSMEGIVNDTADYSVTVSVKAECGSGLETRTATYPSRTARITMYIWNSCMAEGTGITRADGTVVPVEQVRKGDKVISNARGQILTVTDVQHGLEPKPLVRLKDDRGHDVRLTETHPVVLASGEVVAAANVKVKARVRTREGVASITSIERLAYDGQVYNLSLGTPEELAGVGKMERTMFAGGLLVGDNTMQTELNTPKADTRDLLARLPKVWHQDYLNRPVFPADPR